MARVSSRWIAAVQDDLDIYISYGTTWTAAGRLPRTSTLHIDHDLGYDPYTICFDIRQRCNPAHAMFGAIRRSNWRHGTMAAERPWLEKSGDLSLRARGHAVPGIVEPYKSERFDSTTSASRAFGRMCA